jgi:hypothetical protein
MHVISILRFSNNLTSFVKMKDTSNFKVYYHLLFYRPFFVRYIGLDWGIFFTVYVMVRQPGSYNHIHVPCEYVMLLPHLNSAWKQFFSSFQQFWSPSITNWHFFITELIQKANKFTNFQFWTVSLLPLKTCFRPSVELTFSFVGPCWTKCDSLRNTI